MTYKLLYTQTAVKDIRRLDNVVQKRIKKKLEEFAENPISLSKRLVNSAIGTYRFRVGNYRIVFDIDGRNIVVLRVGHRREIYKR